MPDGSTEMARPSLADLLGAEVKASSTIKENCTRIRNAIIALLGTGYFVDGDESDTAWTFAAIQVAVGHTYTASIGPQDAAFLQATKDMLDLMIYLKVTSNPIPLNATKYYNTTTHASAAAAWAAMTSGTIALPGGSTYVSPATGPSASSIWLGGGAGFGGGVWSTWAIDNGQLQFDLSDFLGVITKAEMGAVVLSAAPNWGGALTIDFAGTAMSSSAPPATTDLFSIISLAVNTLDFYVTNFPPSPSNDAVANFVPSALSTYIQLATILTDQ